MTVDYDAPRRVAVDAEEPLRELAVRRNNPADAALDADEVDGIDYVLPGADLFDEELMVRVVPKQPDEFTCSSCFLVHHRSRLAGGGNGASICTDCV
ncbi:MAG: DUF4193 domain-containing protein [Mycobacterium sp.]|nr:DUF4193 domain-containing protein [Mycobacterium sp.]